MKTKIIIASAMIAFILVVGYRSIDNPEPIECQNQQEAVQDRRRVIPASAYRVEVFELTKEDERAYKEVFDSLTIAELKALWLKLPIWSEASSMAYDSLDERGYFEAEKSEDERKANDIMNKYIK